MTTRPGVRESNIELLRIVAMLIIITHHFAVHGIFDNGLTHVEYVRSVDHLSWQLVLTQLVSWGGDMANGIFILITGFFLVQKSCKYKKIAELTFIMFFYAWTISAIFYVVGIFPIHTKVLIKSLVPAWFGYNWFVACYIIFSLFIPFLNPFLLSLERKRYLCLLVLIYFVYAFMPAFFGDSFVSHNRLIEFFFMYAIGGFLRLHMADFLRTDRHIFWTRVLAGLVTAQLAIILMMDGLGYALGKDLLVHGSWHFIGMLNVLIALSLFAYFYTRQSFHSAAVNRVAASVLGIYLIHDNPIVGNFFWNYILPNQDFLGSPYFAVFYMGKVVAVFAICLAIDQLRIIFVTPIYHNATPRVGRFLEVRYQRIYSRVFSSNGRLPKIQ